MALAVQGFVESLRSELIHDGSRVHITTVQLPAVNTPQFDWIKSRIPCRPQPVPPIYQPEVIARVILWASRHRRREISVGLPTVKAIVGDKFIPGLLDHYLAWKGYGAQQTAESVSPDRPSNLFDPLPGDHGAHGRFDEGAYEFSLQFWLNQRRLWLAAAALTSGGYLVKCASARRNERRSEQDAVSSTEGAAGSARVRAAHRRGIYA